MSKNRNFAFFVSSVCTFIKGGNLALQSPLYSGRSPVQASSRPFINMHGTIALGGGPFYKREVAIIIYGLSKLGYYIRGFIVSGSSHAGDQRWLTRNSQNSGEQQQALLMPGNLRNDGVNDGVAISA